MNLCILTSARIRNADLRSCFPTSGSRHSGGLHLLTGGLRAGPDIEHDSNCVIFTILLDFYVIPR